MVRRQRTNFGRELSATSCVELVGVQSGVEPKLLGTRQQAARHVDVEHASLTEDVARRRNALLCNGRKLLFDDVLDVFRCRIPKLAKLGRDGMGTQERRDDV